MSVAVTFDGANKILTAPLGEDGEPRRDVQSIHVFNNGSATVSRWLLTIPELENIMRDGCVWLSVLSGATSPPVYVSDERGVKAIAADYGEVWKSEPVEDGSASDG